MGVPLAFLIELANESEMYVKSLSTFSLWWTAIYYGSLLCQCLLSLVGSFDSLIKLKTNIKKRPLQMSGLNR